MKNLFYFILLAATMALSSCGGGSSKPGATLPSGNIDYQMLSNEAELKNVYEAIQEKLGDAIQYVNEVRIYIRRPSKEETIIREGKPDEFTIQLSCLYLQDKNKLYEQLYTNEQKWLPGAAKGIRLIAGDAETFRLEDEMFDLSPLTAETLSKIVSDAMEKFKDTGKYAYQYIKNIDIENGIVKVKVYGKLSANDMEKSEYYYANLTGAQTDSKGRMTK